MSVEVIGTAPVERVDVLHGSQVCKRCDLILMQTSVAACECSGRVRNIAVAGVRPFGWENSRSKAIGITRFAPVNFLNPERTITETAAGTALTWDSVTTGNLAGIDLWLDQAKRAQSRSRPMLCPAR